MQTDLFLSSHLSGGLVRPANGMDPAEPGTTDFALVMQLAGPLDGSSKSDAVRVPMTLSAKVTPNAAVSGSDRTAPEIPMAPVEAQAGTDRSEQCDAEELEDTPVTRRDKCVVLDTPNGVHAHTQATDRGAATGDVSMVEGAGAVPKLTVTFDMPEIQWFAVPRAIRSHADAPKPEFPQAEPDRAAMFQTSDRQSFFTIRGPSERVKPATDISDVSEAEPMPVAVAPNEPDVQDSDRSVPVEPSIAKPRRKDSVEELVWAQTSSTTEDRTPRQRRGLTQESATPRNPAAAKNLFRRGEFPPPGGSGGKREYVDSQVASGAIGLPTPAQVVEVHNNASDLISQDADRARHAPVRHYIAARSAQIRPDASLAPVPGQASPKAGQSGGPAMSVAQDGQIPDPTAPKQVPRKPEAAPPATAQDVVPVKQPLLRTAGPPQPRDEQSWPRMETGALRSVVPEAAPGVMPSQGNAKSDPALTVVSPDVSDVPTRALPATPEARPSPSQGNGYSQRPVEMDMPRSIAATLPMEVALRRAVPPASADAAVWLPGAESPPANRDTGGFSPAAPQQTTAHQAALARDVAQQLSLVTRAAPGEVTELSLRPEELGQVRMRLVGSEGQIVLQIMSERPETHDLMRRHIEIVERAFRDLGYTDIAFDFSSAGQRDKGPGTRSNADLAEPGADEAPSPVATDVPQPTPGQGRLDIRL